DTRPLPLLAFVLFTKKGELQEPAEHLATHLRDYPREEYSVRLLLDIAERAVAVGDPELERYCYFELMRGEPENKEYRYSWAIASLWLGQRDSVRSECRRLLMDYPSFADASQLLGKVLIDVGRFEEALDVYDQLIRERSGFVPARLWVASILLWQMRDYDGAEESYRNALELAEEGSREQADARAGLARVEEERARTERLGGRMRFLTLLLYGLLAGYAVLFVVLTYLTNPRES
ncbi:MAG: hypothetical protein ACYTDY_04765, partial [Planctomycetota bacterium]